MSVIPMSQMSLGQTGTIEAFSGQEDISQRLQEMGITRGTKIEIVRFAPMGDPIEIPIKGYLLSLRRDEAELIEIHKE